MSASLAEDIKDNPNVLKCDVVVVGGGASGTAAAIQSGRLGVDTCIIEETDWLGGMLTSAGVSGIDGDPAKTSGIFREFLNRIATHYRNIGKIDETHYCKVSPFCFEPAVGAQILLQMASEVANLKIYFNSTVTKIYKDENKIAGIEIQDKQGEKYVIPAHVVIDATEFGDLMYMAGIPYDIGLDVGSDEPHAGLGEQCLQPLTYVALLEFSADEDLTISKPANYDIDNYKCTIKNPLCPDSNSQFDKDRIFSYGFLPNNKLMINVPSHSYGNDYNATAEELETMSRDEILQKAKDYTAGYIYFMQKELGFYKYGLSDEFGTADKFAKIPYIRESRRLKGSYRLTENDILPDNDGRSHVFADSIAIGDYAIDLHFCERGKGDVYYHVPPYQIPYGVTIPETIDGFMVAEKNISVSHVVNGTTRMQPVVMQVGQAVGLAAAISVQDDVQPRDVSIEKLHEKLIAAGSTVFYFKDLSSKNYAYPYVTKLALKKIIRGDSEFSFRPNHPINNSELVTILARSSGFYELSYGESVDFLKSKNILSDKMDFSNPADSVKRRDLAGVIAKLADPGNEHAFAQIHFRDVTAKDHFYDDVAKLTAMEIVNSDKQRFRPDDAATRAEAVTMIGRALAL